MRITLKVRPGGRKSPVAAVRETIASVRPMLTPSAEVTEVFPGVQSGNRAGMVTVSLGNASADDADAVLEALKARADVVYAEPVSGRTAKSPTRPT